MKKRTKIIAINLLAALSCTLLLVGCGGGDTHDGHTHTYSDEWSSDGTHHYHAAMCEHTDEKKDMAEHVWGGNTCTVCKYRKPTEGLNFRLSSNKNEYFVSGVGLASEPDILIPSEYNGLPVTSIGEDAFKDCDWVESITIPKSITIIGEDAFSGCSALESVTIPDSVTSLESRAFYHCTALEGITIPNSVKSIGYGAFTGCSALKSIVIPDSVTSLGSVAFSGCSALESITIPESVSDIGGGIFWYCDSLQYNVYNGANYLGDEKNPYYILAGTTSKSITSCDINENTKIIYDDAFSDCSALKSIRIPNSVTSIGYRAFQSCSALESITLSNKLTAIYSWAFEECKALKSITIPSSVKEIGNCAFEDCTSLESITIPDSVNDMGEGVFNGCSKLVTAVLGKGVTKLKAYNYGTYQNAFFEKCKSLKTVTIRGELSEIEENTFAWCEALQEINYAGTKAHWNAVAKGEYWDVMASYVNIRCKDGTL